MNFKDFYLKEGVFSAAKKGLSSAGKAAKWGLKKGKDVALAVEPFSRSGYLGRLATKMEDLDDILKGRKGFSRVDKDKKDTEDINNIRNIISKKASKYETLFNKFIFKNLTEIKKVINNKSLSKKKFRDDLLKIPTIFVKDGTGNIFITSDFDSNKNHGYTDYVASKAGRPQKPKDVRGLGHLGNFYVDAIFEFMRTKGYKYKGAENIVKKFYNPELLKFIYSYALP